MNLLLDSHLLGRLLLIHELIVRSPISETFSFLISFTKFLIELVIPRYFFVGGCLILSDCEEVRFRTLLTDSSKVQSASDVALIGVHKIAVKIVGHQVSVEDVVFPSFFICFADFDSRTHRLILILSISRYGNRDHFIISGIWGQIVTTCYWFSREFKNVSIRTLQTTEISLFPCIHCSLILITVWLIDDVRITYVLVLAGLQVPAFLLYLSKHPFPQFKFILKVWWNLLCKILFSFTLFSTLNITDIVSIVIWDQCAVECLLHYGIWLVLSRRAYWISISPFDFLISSIFIRTYVVFVVHLREERIQDVLIHLVTSEGLRCWNAQMSEATLIAVIDILNFMTFVLRISLPAVVKVLLSASTYFIEARINVLHSLLIGNDTIYVSCNI